MRLYTLLSRIPYSLLISSLTLAATALPVESQEVELRVLTPDDFDQTVANGVWFIEHFSPYCGHCRRFAPTWTKLVEEVEKQEDPGIHLAQVNCAVHGDLCSKNKVDGYPQMNLYHNGEYVDTYKQPRELDILLEYVAAHAEHTAKPTSTPPAITSTPKEETVQIPAPPPKVYNPAGTVTSLDEKSFAETVKEGHVFIKFFAPWCGHCKKLAPIWVTLASVMRGKVNIAEVDCEDHAAICRSQGVNGYPMLFYYAGGGKGKTEYSGGRKLNQLQAFVEKVSGPPVQELKYEDLQGAVADHSVIYLLLHPTSDTQSVNEITDASQVLFGSPPVYVSSARSFYDHFNVQQSQAMVLAFKDHDYSAPAAIYPLPQYSRSASQEGLADWLLRNRLPTTLELDSDTFQDVMNAEHKPLVVLVATPPSEYPQVSEKVKDIGKRWKDSKARGDVVFTWMDSDKWGKWLKSMYGIKADAGVQIIVANHSRLIYYDVDQRGQKIALSSTSIFSVINGAQAGTISYKNSENIVERFARYMNQKLNVIEHVVSNHPWRVTFVVLVTLGCIIFYLRRVIYRESALADELNRKARLD